ncbi:hypothetical protein [Chryseobacterium sp. T20]|uniref:hypothetical protein n=1 Tax=Chryseobacterium sp. T20 TaxID=3395375 RepID=UPI0039BD7E02
MKKLLLLSVFILAGLIKANENKTHNSDFKNEKTTQSVVFTRYLITLKTVCGTTYQTILDTDFDTYDCVNNEWEMYNQQDCGHASYENPPV